MIHYTNYANQKFDILNQHKVFVRKEEVEEAILQPDEVKAQDNFIGAVRENLKVIYRKDGEIIKIITFFPVK